MGGLLVLSVSCAVEAPTDLGASALGENVQPIIYGEDDRQELYAVSDPAVREIGWSSVAAMIHSSLLYRPPSGGVRVTASTLKQSYRLCASKSSPQRRVVRACSSIATSC